MSKIIQYVAKLNAQQMRNELSDIKKTADQIKIAPITQPEIEKLKETNRQILRIKEIAEKNSVNGAIINTPKLQADLKLAGISVGKFNEGITSLGANKGITTVEHALSKIPKTAEKAETSMQKLGKTIANSMRYAVVNKFVDALGNAFAGVSDFYRSTDKQLTQIQIVSGKSEKALDKMYKTGIQGAKEYGRYTREYLETAQIYYQQGLSQNEVMERTNATIMASNISGQSVSTTADQVTAVLNGFNVEASRTVEVLDMMAKIGAETATDFEETASAIQKVASSASETGMEIENTLAMLATMSSVTREAPETIGTSLNAIIGRISGLNAASDGVMDTYTSAVESAMINTGSGLSIFDDQTGLLKDTTTILTEVAEKWDEIDVNQQRALTKAIAGQRQANRLMALLGNWDMYEDYTDKAKNASGALEEQNEVYLNSYEAAQKKLASTMEELWSNLMPRDSLEEFTKTLTDIAQLFANITKNIGGMEGILLGVSPLLGSVLSSGASQFATNKMKEGYVRKETRKQTDSAINSLSDEGQKKNIKTLLGGVSTEADAQIIKDALIVEEQLKTSQETVKSLGEALKKAADIDVDSFKGYSEAVEKYNKSQSSIASEIEKNKKELEKLIEKDGDIVKQSDLRTKIAELSARKESEQVGFGEIEKAQNKAVKDSLANLSVVKNSTESTEIKNAIDSLYAKIARELQIDIDKVADHDFTPEQLAKVGKSVEGTKAEVLKKGDAQYAAAAKEEDKLKKQSDESQTKLDQLAKEERVTKAFNAFTKGAIGAASALKTFNTYSDASATSQEKMSSLVPLVGSALQMIPGWGTAAAMAINVLGPVFIEAFGIGETASEKLRKSLEATTESVRRQTEAIKQQRKEYVSVYGSYEALAKKYEEQAFTVKDLTEAEKTQHDQVAEYVEQYAPELIKYYDDAGNAVVDFANGVDYLNKKMNENEAETYLAMQSDLIKNAEQIILLQKLDIADKDKLLEKIEKQRQKVANGGGIFSNAEKESKILKELEAQLDEVQERITSFSKSWSENFVEPILRSNVVFRELDEQIQNSLRSAMDYGSFNSSGLDASTFQSQADILVKTIGMLSEEQQEAFSSISESVRNSVMEILIQFTNLSNKSKEILLTGGEESFISGGFIDYSQKSDDYYAQTGANNNLSNELETGRDEAFKKSYAAVSSNGVALDDKQQENYVKIFETNAAKDVGADVNSESGIRAAQEAKEKYLKEETDYYDRKAEIAEKGTEEYEKQLEEGIRVEEANLDKLEDLWMSGLMEFTKTAEGYNKALEQYQKDKESLVQGDNESDIAFENRIEQNQKMLAVLLQDDEDYFTELRSLNHAEMAEIQNTYGISAENYKTLAEYKLAVDTQMAKARELIESMVGKTIEEKEQALLQFKVQNMATELTAKGQFEEAALLLAMSGADQEKIVKHETYINEKNVEIQLLKDRKAALESQLAAFEASKNQEVQALADATNEKIKLYNAEGAAAAAAAGTEFSAMGTVSAGTVGGYADVLKGEIANIGAQITNAENQVGEAEDFIKSILGSNKNNSLTSGIAKDIEALLKGTSGLNFDVKGDYDLNFKDIPKSPTSDTASSAGSSSSEKNVEDLEVEIDYLRKYKLELKEIQRQLDRLSDEKDMAFGKDRINLLKEESKLLESQTDTYSRMLNTIKEKAKEEKSNVSGINSNIAFDEQGRISNYNEIILAAERAVNKLSGEAKEEAKNNYSDFIKQLDKYESVLDDMIEAENNLRDSVIKRSSIELEAITATLELEINLNKQDIETLAIVDRLAKLKGGKIALSLDFGSSLKEMTTVGELAKTLMEQMGAGGAANIVDILNNSSLTDADKASALEEIKANLIGAFEDLADIIEELDEMFEESLGSVISLLESQLSKFDSIIDQYEYMIELTSRLSNGDTKMTSNLLAQMAGIYTTQKDAWDTISKDLKASRDSFEVGTEDWTVANDKYMQAMDSLMENEKSLLDVLERQFDLQVSDGRNKLEEALFGGSTLEETQEALDKINKERNKYLDVESRIYEMSKMQRDMEKDIDKYKNNPKAQKELEKFMQEELKYLKSKEKLTQTDLELSQKQYDVVKARIEMEQAREQEQFVQMLQRNADGSFGFVMVQSDENLKEAQQAYQDALHELNEFAQKEQQKLEQESIDVRKEFMEEYDKISKKLKDGTIDQEEAMNLLTKASENMVKQLEENAKKQAEMKQQIATSEILQLLGEAGKDFSGLEDQAAAVESAFDALDKAGKSATISESLYELGYDLDQFNGSFGEQINQLIESLGEDGIDILMQELVDSGETLAATILAFIGENSDFAALQEQIVRESLNGAGEGFNELLDQISSGTIKPEDLFTESMNNGLADVEEAWKSLNGQLNVDLGALNEMFNADNPESLVSGIMNGIFAAYNEYSKSVEGAKDRMDSYYKELGKVTETLTSQTNKLTTALGEEISKITSLQKEYSNLRGTIIDSMEALKNKIKEIDTAMNNMYSGSSSGSSTTTTPPSTSGSGSSSAPSTSIPTVNWGGSELKGGMKVRVKDGTRAYHDSYGGSPTSAALSGSNSYLIDDYGIFRNRSHGVHVSNSSGGDIGWVPVNSVAKFHVGGLVDTSEGLAVLKKNEKVLTEKQSDVVSKIYDNLNKIGNMGSRAFSPAQPAENVEYNITAEFPNATNKDEIMEAFATLKNNASQYLSRK